MTSTYVHSLCHLGTQYIYFFSINFLLLFGFAQKSGSWKNLKFYYPAGIGYGFAVGELIKVKPFWEGFNIKFIFK